MPITHFSQIKLSMGSQILFERVSKDQVVSGFRPQTVQGSLPGNNPIQVLLNSPKAAPTVKYNLGLWFNYVHSFILEKVIFCISFNGLGFSLVKLIKVLLDKELKRKKKKSIYSSLTLGLHRICRYNSFSLWKLFA